MKTKHWIYVLHFALYCFFSSTIYAEQTPCAGDSDSDRDVDGIDLQYKTAYSPHDGLDVFAGEFGRMDCEEGNPVPEHIAEAVAAAENEGATFPLLSSSGAVAGIRANMATHFPLITDLINGGFDAQDYMLQAFEGTPPFAEDMQLTIYAYALEKMGDVNAAATLQSFIINNMTGSLYLSPHFATHAIKVLNNDADIAKTIYYTAAEKYNTATQSTSSVFDDTFSLKSNGSDTNEKSCARQYLLLDENGDPISYIDSQGQTRQAIVHGLNFHANDLTDSVKNDLLSKIESDANAYYIDDDPEFPGEPSNQFNCAGYAFRHFNRGKRWIADPAQMHLILVTRTQLLVEVKNEQDAEPGDIVFYFREGGSVDHVAEMRSRTVYGDMIVRNADGYSGLFEALAGAAVFDVYGDGYKIYRWAKGGPPNVMYDPSVVGKNGYCQDEKILQTSFSGPGNYSEIWHEYQGVVMNHQCSSATEYRIEFSGSGYMEISYYDYINMKIDFNGTTYYNPVYGTRFGVICEHVDREYMQGAGGGPYANGNFSTHSIWAPEYGGVVGTYDLTSVSGQGRKYYPPGKTSTILNFQINKQRSP